MIPGQPPPLSAQQIDMVDLFAGPGGLDVAAHWLGVTAKGIEWDENACATREAAELDTEQADVRDCKPADYPHAKILAGGPPCQTYTVAGTGAGRRALDQVLSFVDIMADGRDVTESLDQLDDDRTGLVLQPLKWALDAADRGEPYEAIVLEQVPAVLPVWKAVKAVLEEKLDYNVDFGILHTEEFGVPQTRRRAILIARLKSAGEARLPAPTHRRYRKDVPRDRGDSRLLKWETMGRALPRRKPFIVISNYGTGGDPKARGRRTSAEPAATVTGKISRNRLVTRGDVELERFSVAEAGRLQTFPSDYPWSGNDVAQQIGNAIPPRLAAHVLAAALGKELDSRVLDACVEGEWRDTKGGVPLLARPFDSV